MIVGSLLLLSAWCACWLGSIRLCGVVLIGLGCIVWVRCWLFVLAIIWFGLLAACGGLLLMCLVCCLVWCCFGVDGLGCWFVGYFLLTVVWVFASCVRLTLLIYLMVLLIVLVVYLVLWFVLAFNTIYLMFRV